MLLRIGRDGQSGQNGRSRRPLMAHLFDFGSRNLKTISGTLGEKSPVLEKIEICKHHVKRHLCVHGHSGTCACTYNMSFARAGRTTNVRLEVRLLEDRRHLRRINLHECSLSHVEPMVSCMSRRPSSVTAIGSPASQPPTSRWSSGAQPHRTHLRTDMSAVLAQ